METSKDIPKNQLEETFPLNIAIVAGWFWRLLPKATRRWPFLHAGLFRQPQFGLFFLLPMERLYFKSGNEQSFKFTDLLQPAFVG